MTTDNEPWKTPKNAEINSTSYTSTSKQKNNTSNSDNKNNQQPPDIEKALKDLLNKFKNSANSGKGGGNKPSNPIVLPYKALSLIVAIVLIAIYIILGFSAINESERGVVKRFGAYSRILQPGLNWVPPIIDTVSKVNVTRVDELRTDGSMLTKDENLVKVILSVQYKVSKPEDFLFKAQDPVGSLKEATDSALRYVVGHMSMDDILTTGRSVVREDTWKYLNDIIKNYYLGIEVIDVNFQAARPPEAVKDAFDDAIKAQEDEQRFIREAEAYSQAKEPIARGDAQRIVEAANAYKEQVVLKAQGEASRFLDLVPLYKSNPELFKNRMYIDIMSSIYSRTPKVIAQDGMTLNFLPIDKLFNQGNGSLLVDPSKVNNGGSK